jgi:stearoyl-CoA desaturase (Delta-9 desaturase)
MGGDYDARAHPPDRRATVDEPLSTQTPPKYTSGGTSAGTRIDQAANIFVTMAPLVLVLYAAVLAWNHSLHWQSLLIFFVMFIPLGFGITVGFHRLFTHRSFKTGPRTRAVWGALGSMAVEGPIIEWVAYHRRHHTFSDQEGDPHSPHVDHGDGLSGAIKGLFYAHVGWVMFSEEPAEEERYAPDLMRDPILRFIDRTFLLWVGVGLVIPFGLGYLLTGTLQGALEGLLWGGAVRIFVLHQVTFCINSLCHFFGQAPFDTGDESRNLRWLAPFTFGESWHNNHHAFPTSARHGIAPHQLDLSAGVITIMEKLGLAWDVVRVDPERVAARAAAAAQ